MFFFFRNGKQSMTLAEITEQLNALRIPTTLVFTPINFWEEREKFLKSDDYNPQFKYRIIKNNNEAIFKELSSVKEVSNVDPRISEFYVKLIDEKREASNMMNAAGNNGLITEISKKRFGKPTAKGFRNASRILRGRTEKYNLVKKEEIMKSRWVKFDEIKEAMDLFLKEIGLDDWKIGPSKNIMKNGVKTGLKLKEIRMDPNIKKRAFNVRKTIVHEIGTHILRSYNGLLTGYDALSKANLVTYLDVEEGLAFWNEENMGVLSIGQFRKKVLGTYMMYMAENMTFRETFNILLGQVPRLDAYDIAYRIKRGLGNTSLPGLYTKDVVYIRGFARMRVKLANDKSLYKKLYAGKIDFSQVSWVDDGLIPQPKLLPDFESYKKIFEKAGI
jgi:hypothetical protein